MCGESSNRFCQQSRKAVMSRLVHTLVVIKVMATRRRIQRARDIGEETPCRALAGGSYAKSKLVRSWALAFLGEKTSHTVSFVTDQVL